MSRCSTVLLLTLALAAPLHAQTTANGNIFGTIRDSQGAVLPGVAVSATSPDAPGQHRATTDGRGEYRLVGLAPGDYTIVGELAGFAMWTRSQVTMRAGLTIEVNATMGLGTIAETVVVTQEAPLLERRNAVQAVNIDGQLLQKLPLSERREWFGALTLVPGVITSDFSATNKQFFVHGTDGHNLVMQIDGADVGSATPAGVHYLSLSTDAIKDIQIRTAGLDASAPLGVGGIVNIATASGTNRVTGAGTLFIQPRGWNDSNVPGGTSSAVDQTQADLSLGNPIVRNRLWAFVAYRYANIASGLSRTATQIEALRGLIPGYEPFDTTNEAQFWLLKLNAQLAPSHHLSGFYQYDVNPLMVADPLAEHPREQRFGGTGAAIRLASVWSDRLTMRLGASYNDKHRDDFNQWGNESFQRIHQSAFLSAGRLTGNGRLVDRGSPLSGWSLLPSSKLIVSLDTTMFVSGWLGTHELQTGLYAQPRIRNAFFNFYANGGFAFEESLLRRPGDYSAGVIPFHRITFDAETETRTMTAGQNYAIYVQDAWRPTPRLTINAGVRVDQIVWRDRLFDVTTQRSTDVGPRFGLNYAITADARNVARAHWVRVHDQPQSGLSVGASLAGRSDSYDLDLDGTFETVFTTPATFSIAPNRSIDPNFHQPFVDEWGLGYSRQLEGQTSIGVDVVHRDFRDRIGGVETNGRYDGKTFVGYANEAFNELFSVTNNRWNWPAYTSLELSFTKRTARMQGIASYVRQWQHIAGTWQPNDPASFIQPDAFRNDRGIGSTTGSTSIDVNSLSGFHMTNAATGAGQWQDHVIRLGFTYAAPWNVLLASNYTFQSGAWSGPIVMRIPTPDPAFGPTTVRLSNGRVVSNPLATVIRFAYPTRGEGQTPTPHLHIWNVRVGRGFSWAKRTLDISLDVFNVTNADADMRFEFGANQTYNALFGATSVKQLPRSAQAVVRVSF
ncbi:MAG TPA: TonB-dependent receptor [Vicinamibacterales bacterium]|nr:TonB-dependent receptor [Vicinamibacterales bacterium]